jgi:hypothetical protein
MPFRDKFIIALTILLLIAGPYMTYKTIEAGMSESINLVRATADSSVAVSYREAAEIKRRYMPPIVIGQVVTFITAHQEVANDNRFGNQISNYRHSLSQ